MARAFALIRFGERSKLRPQLLRVLAGLAAPLAVVIFFKVRVGPPGDVLSVPASAILKHLTDVGRWIMTAEGLVIALFTFGRFLIPIVLALALYGYLVRFQADRRDRAALATAGIALGLTITTELLVDLLLTDNLALEISTSFERILLQLWPAALLMFFLASGPLQLVPPKPYGKVSKEKKTARPARRVPATR
jgi:hypothetical protein